MAMEDQVRKIIAAQLELDAAQLTPEVHFRELPNISSMKILQIILEVERALDIELDDDVTFRVETVGQFEDEVRRLCSQRNEPVDVE